MLLPRQRELYQVRQSACGSGQARVLYTRRQQVPITIIRIESTRHVYRRPRKSRRSWNFSKNSWPSIGPT